MSFSPNLTSIFEVTPGTSFKASSTPSSLRLLLELGLELLEIFAGPALQLVGGLLVKTFDPGEFP